MIKSYWRFKLMHWLSIIVIGLTANLDNLGIGVSFGAKRTKISFLSNLIIAALSMVAAFLSISFGNIISSYVPPKIANWTGSILIILIGAWSIKSSIKSQIGLYHEEPLTEEEGISALLRNPSKADIDGNNVISWRESFTLGFALALNCIASGLGVGVSGLSPVASTLSIGLFSLITVEIGMRVGNQIAMTWFGKYTNVIGGTLIVGIGIYEIFI
jgi:putative sporulation protein YtaF